MMSCSRQRSLFSLNLTPFPAVSPLATGSAFNPWKAGTAPLPALPSELTFRRWENFGRSGAKLIWGGEAAAIRHDGRANPNQLLINEANLPAIMQLRQRLVETHAALYDNTSDLLIGLQLTHSGRYAQPNRKGVPEPLTLYRHPYLDPRLGISDDSRLLSDDQIHTMIGQFADAAELAQAAGFHFVDLKHCHGYLGHEFLSAYTRPGPYGGSFENRTRFLQELVSAIRNRCPGLRLAVRLSVFDMPPFNKHPETQIGVPVSLMDDRCYWFGANPQNPWEVDLAEPARFLALCQDLGIEMVNLTAGSPYYNPHIQRPALFPPSDGYLPPEDPLAGVARQIQAAAASKQRFPGSVVVGTAYTYLQEWLANVAQYNLRNQGRSISPAWDGWCWRIRSCLLIFWQADRCSANVSAAPSVTVPPPRAKACPPAVIPWMNFTRAGLRQQY